MIKEEAMTDVKPNYDLQRQARHVLSDSNGVPTLGAIVLTAQARLGAEVIVRGSDGVTSVINELDVI